MNERADFLTEGGRLFPSSIILGSFQDRSGVLVDGTEVSIRFNSRAYIYPVGGGLPDGLSRIFRDEPSCQKIRPPYLSGQLPVKHAHSMDAGSQERPAACGAWLIFTPRASEQSAVLHWEEAARFPCFATFMPPAAATRAEVVEILKLWALSPPVPTISNTSMPVSTWAAWTRMAAAQPAISSVVSARALFVERAARKAAFWGG